MYFVIKISKHIQFIYQKKILKITWHYCRQRVKINCNVYIKEFNRSMCNKTRHNDEKEFCMNYWQCFNSNEILTNRREVCLEINGKQAIKMSEKGINT